MTVMSFYLAKSRKVRLSVQAQKGKKKIKKLKVQRKNGCEFVF
jgi:hypothetical protein